MTWRGANASGKPDQQEIDGHADANMGMGAHCLLMPNNKKRLSVSICRE